MTQTLEQRIAEAREERDWLRNFLPTADRSIAVRLLGRAECRLSDLEAVRDGLAVEVYATCLVDAASHWNAFGSAERDPDHGDVVAFAGYAPGDRITVLRGIAYKPVSTVDEVEAESEDA